MSSTEKLLNKQLLDKVHQAGLDAPSTQQHQLLQQTLSGSQCVRTATAAKRAQQT